MEKLELLTKQEILGKEFVAYGTVENPLFLAKDVAKWIEHSDVHKMVQSVDEDEKVRNNVPTLGGVQESWFLTENGLYEVLMLSRKPIAKQFKKEVKNLLHNLRLNKVTIISTKSQQELDNETDRNKIAKANIYLELAKQYESYPNYKQILNAYATKELSGKFVLPLPEANDEEFTATEAGEKLGVSKNVIGKLANRLGIKVDGKFGHWHLDKSPYSSKEVRTFRYTQKAIDFLKAELEKERT